MNQNSEFLLNTANKNLDYHDFKIPKKKSSEGTPAFYKDGKFSHKKNIGSGRYIFVFDTLNGAQIYIDLY